MPSLDLSAVERTSPVGPRPEIVGRSPCMRALRLQLERLAASDVTVLIEGETGTGKELVAEWLHCASRRASGPFVVFDCGAVAPALIESELFGHLPGAFTGAVRARTGVFEEAHGGTLFLDELGELPLALQPKLLRLIERRQGRRVGAGRTMGFDVRVVAATNRNLSRQVRAGRFRKDLYFRVAGARVVVPPLRERLEDLPLLVDWFLRTEHGRTRQLPAALWAPFLAHRWPGNVRELRNAVQCAAVNPERALASLQSDDGRAANDGAPDEDKGPLPLRAARRRAMEEFERGYLEDLLKATAGNVSRAAQLSGVSRQMLHRLLRKHRVRLPGRAGLA